MRYLFFIVVILLEQEVPYKASEDFDVTIDYQFKAYREEVHKDVDFSEQKKRTGLLPYLIAQVKIKNISQDEVRIRVISNDGNNAVNRKLIQDMILKVDFGFVDEVKDRTKPYEYTVSFISIDKKEITRIVLFIDTDGTFLVNGQKRGRF